MKNEGTSIQSETPPSETEVKDIVKGENRGRIQTSVRDAERDDIPVEVTTKEVEKQAYYNDVYPDVPAGAQISPDTVSKGTIGTFAWDKDLKEYVWVTAGHVVDSSGVKMMQPRNLSHRFGESDKYIQNGVFDVATIQKVSENKSWYREHNNRLAADDGGYRDYIRGWLSSDHLENMIDGGGSDYYEIHKQGRSTGLRVGDLANVTRKYDWNTQMMDWKLHVKGTLTDGGDSGGPHFHYEDSDYGYKVGYIAGIHGWGVGDTEAHATTFEHVHHRFDLDI